MVGEVLVGASDRFASCQVFGFKIVAICVFRGDPATDSDSIRPPIPI